MYIPKEVIFYILGFISFPIIAYVVYKAKGWDKEESKDEKDIK